MIVMDSSMRSKIIRRLNKAAAEAREYGDEYRCQQLMRQAYNYQAQQRQYY